MPTHHGYIVSPPALRSEGLTVSVYIYIYIYIYYSVSVVVYRGRHNSSTGRTNDTFIGRYCIRQLFERRNPFRYNAPLPAWSSYRLIRRCRRPPIDNHADTPTITSRGGSVAVSADVRRPERSMDRRTSALEYTPRACDGNKLQP